MPHQPRAAGRAAACARRRARHAGSPLLLRAPASARPTSASTQPIAEDRRDAVLLDHEHREDERAASSASSDGHGDSCGISTISSSSPSTGVVATCSWPPSSTSTPAPSRARSSARSSSSQFGYALGHVGMTGEVVLAAAARSSSTRASAPCHGSGAGGSAAEVAHETRFPSSSRIPTSVTKPPIVSIRLYVVQPSRRDTCTDAPRHPEQPDDVHREEEQVRPDEDDPEADLPGQLVVELPGDLREPVVHAAEDREDGRAEDDVVEVGDDEVRVRHLLVERDRQRT